MRTMLVEHRRGGVAEAVHPIHAVLSDAPGRVLDVVGRDLTTTFRSAAKPFQLEVAHGLLPGALKAQIESEDLAIGAASHHGEPFHIAQVERLLGRLGHTADELLCGAHAPTHLPSMQALYAGGGTPSPLHNNCSGKHAFMVAAAQALGAATDYRPEDHPLQRRVRARLDERTGGAVQTLVLDGCGIPCFVLPLSAMARAWAQLAEELRRGEASALSQIGAAMRAHPLLMSGSDAFDGWLIRTANVVAKIGAQGLLCIAFLDCGQGAAIKVASGVDGARPAAALALLEHWFPGAVDRSQAARLCEVTNVRGDVVGEITARFT